VPFGDNLLELLQKFVVLQVHFVTARCRH